MLAPTTVGLLSGAALLGTAGLRAMLGTSKLLRQRSDRAIRSEQGRQAFADQISSALQWARASQPGLKGWLGTRNFHVTRVVDEAIDCRSFHLTPVDGQPLTRYLPGQYLTFHLPTTDPQRPLVRCYSLSDRPREDDYRVTIKRVPAPADSPELPPGLGSNFFHDRIGVGSVLACEAPQGSFFLDPSDRSPLVLLGAGIGVTPLISILATLAAYRDDREVWLLTGYRNSDHQPFRDELQVLRQQLPQLRVLTSFSAAKPEDQLGRDYEHDGRLDIQGIRNALPSSNYHYYICGPGGLMQQVVPGLWEWGVPREHVHFEAFGPATIQGLHDDDYQEATVQFARSQRAAQWLDPNQTLLDLATTAGVELASGCRAGSCGQCRVNVAAGKVKHLKPPGVELVDGECLPCIATPQSDVVIDA